MFLQDPWYVVKCSEDLTAMHRTSVLNGCCAAVFSPQDPLIMPKLLKCTMDWSKPLAMVPANKTKRPSSFHYQTKLYKTPEWHSSSQLITALWPREAQIIAIAIAILRTSTENQHIPSTGASDSLKTLINHLRNLAASSPG